MRGMAAGNDREKRGRQDRLCLLGETSFTLENCYDCLDLCLDSHSSSVNEPSTLQARLKAHASRPQHYCCIPVS